MSIQVHPNASEESLRESEKTVSVENFDTDGERQVDPEDQEVSLWPIIKWTLLGLLGLWIIHMTCIVFAVLNIKSQVENQSFKIDTLKVDLAGKDGIEIRAKAGIQPSLWFYSFLFKLYKPAKVSFAVPSLGIHQDAITVQLPALTFGHEHTMIDLTDNPLKIDLKEINLKAAFDSLAMSTGNFSRLNGHVIEAELKVQVSFFTMTFWVPVWLDRTITIPIKVPIKASKEKKKEKEILISKPNIVIPDHLDILDKDGDLNVSVGVRLDYSALPIELPLELNIPELSVTVGSKKGSFLEVTLPTQQMTPTNPLLSASITISNQGVDHLAAMIYDLARLDLTSTLSISTRGRRQDCALQKMVSFLIPSWQLSLEQIMQIAANAKTSMTAGAGKEGDILLPDTSDRSADAHRLVDVQVKSITAEGRSAVAKVLAQVTLPEGSPPLDIIHNLPSFTAQITDNQTKQPLARVDIQMTAKRENLCVDVQAVLYNLTPILQSLIMSSDCLKGASLNGFPAGYRDKSVTIAISSSHPALNKLLQSIQIQAGKFDDATAKVWLSGAPDTDLLFLPKRLKMMKGNNGDNGNKIMKKSQVTAQHKIIVDHVHDSDQFAVNVTAALQPHNLSSSPYISINIPDVYLQVSSDAGPFAHGHLNAATVNLSLRPGTGHPLANLWSPTGVAATVRLEDDPVQCGRRLGLLVNQVLQKDLLKVTIGATTEGPTAAKFAQTIVIPPKAPLVREVTLPEKIVKPMVRFLKSPTVGVRAFREGQVFAGVAWRNDLVECEKCQFEVDVRVNLPEIGARLSVNNSSVAQVSVPETSLSMSVGDFEICEFKVHQSVPLGDSQSLLVSLALMVREEFLTETILSMVNGKRLDVAVGGGLKGRYLDKMLNNLNLNLAPPPAASTSATTIGVKREYSEGADPLKIEAFIDSEKNTFQIAANVELPPEAGTTTAPTATNLSPIMKIHQEPILMSCSVGHFSVEFSVSQIMIPIKLEAGLPFDSRQQYSRSLSVKMVAECDSCTSDSIHSAISQTLSGDDAQMATLKMSVGGVGEEHRVDLRKLKPILEFVSKTVKNTMSNPPPKNTTVTTTTKQQGNMPDWLNVKVVANSVNQSVVGLLPCPLAEICPKNQTDTLNPLISISVIFKDLLQNVLSQVDITPLAARLAIPTKPTGIRLAVGLKSELGVKVSVSRSVDLVAIRIRPFMLSTSREETITADLFVNGGGPSLHALTSPLKLLPIPRLDQVPSSLARLPFAVNLGAHSDNLLCHLVTGLVLDLPITLPAPQQSVTKRDAEKGTVGMEYKITEVTDNSIGVDVTITRSIVVPPGINLALGQVEVSLQDGQQHQLITVRADGNLSGQIDGVTASIRLADSLSLGQLVGDIISGRDCEINLSISIGEAKMRLPVEYRPKEAILFSLSRQLLLDSMKRMRISNQVTPTIVKKEKQNSLAFLDEPIIPDLPILLDPIPLIFKRLLQSIYKCIDQPNTLFTLLTRLALKPSLLPGELSKLKAGLVGVRLSGQLSRSLAYYYARSKKNLLGVSHSNTVMIGPTECVPQEKDGYEQEEYTQCARSKPFILLGDSDSKSVLTRKKSKYIADTGKVLNEITSAIRAVAPFVGIPPTRLDNVESMLALVMGDVKHVEELSKKDRLAITATYSDARHIIDSVVNEGGLCVRLPEGGGFVEVVVGKNEPGGQLMPLRVPLENLRIPVPIDRFADPCGQFSSVCDSTESMKTASFADSTTTSVQLTSPSKPSSQAWTDISMDPLGNWQLNFTFTQHRHLALHRHRRQMPALSLMLKSTSNLFSLNFIPHYDDKNESNALRLARELPYLAKAEHFFQSMVAAADAISNPSGSPPKLVTANQTNAISLRLNNRPLYVDDSDIKAVKVNGVFPPLTDTVNVKIKYSAVDRLLTTECWDGVVDDTIPSPPVYRTVFPVDLPSILKEDTVKVGFGAQAGRGLTIYSFGVDNVSYTTDSVDPSRADLFTFGNDSHKMVIRLRDGCGRPQLSRRQQQLQVRMVNNGYASEIIVAENVDGMFRFEWSAQSAGTFYAEIRMDEQAKWHRLQDHPVYITGPW